MLSGTPVLHSGGIAACSAELMLVAIDTHIARRDIVRWHAAGSCESRIAFASTGVATDQRVSDKMDFAMLSVKLRSSQWSAKAVAARSLCTSGRRQRHYHRQH